MKHTATLLMMITLGVATAYAQQFPVRMGFSGTSGASVINLQQPNTGNVEETFAGLGTLGSFTYRSIRAPENTPVPSTTCSGPTKVYFNTKAGAGVFRFEDGSLLFVQVVGGGDCIDFASPQAHCTLTLKIVGGSGRFTNVSGTLTFTETSVIVTSDAMNNPVYFAGTGEFTGTISGVGRADNRQEQPQ